MGNVRYHVFMEPMGREYFIAMHRRQLAGMLGHDDEEAVASWVLLPDDMELVMNRPHDGRTVTRTCAEWAERERPGVLAVLRMSDADP